MINVFMQHYQKIWPNDDYRNLFNMIGEYNPDEELAELFCMHSIMQTRPMQADKFNELKNRPRGTIITEKDVIVHLSDYRIRRKVDRPLVIREF